MDSQPPSLMPSLALTPPNPEAIATTAGKSRPLHQSSILIEKRQLTQQIGYGFGITVPSENHPFPARANLTAVELLTFFPLSTRCADVIYRLITNGGMYLTIWAIVNTQRELTTKWSRWTCRGWMCKAMDDAGYTGWTVATHDKLFEQYRAFTNEYNLNVGGFRTPGQVKGRSAPSANILFKDLVSNVRQMPTGGDALDLTRMVQYCVERPNESWLYPRDYDALLNFFGGPAPIQEEHTDRAAFARWEGTKPPSPRLAPSAPPPEEHKGQRQKEIETSSATTSLLEAPPLSATPIQVLSSGESSRDSFVMWNSSRETMPVPATAPKRGRPKGARNKAPKSKAQVVTDPVVPAKAAMADTYVRQAAEYVPPPEGTIEPTFEEIALAFAKEHHADEIDPRSPYAFGGPRESAPYRMLYLMRQPHPGDSSGWAENLRWAFEQSACFQFSYRPHGWNESPEHMERIVEIRNRQYWMSDELGELRWREQEREKEAKRLSS